MFYICVWECRLVEYLNMLFNGIWKDKRELGVNEKINYVYDCMYKMYWYLDRMLLIINVFR